MMRRALALGMLGFLTQGLLIPAMGQPLSGSPTRFDGQWSVSIVCETATDGAAGYITNFMAEVRNGTMHGEHGIRQQSGWLSLDGQIKPDGTALLLATGLTGSSNFNVGKVMPDTPYSYHVDAHFDAKQGGGTRVELRPCRASFAKAG
jgi:hypothetical protein